MNRPTPDTQIPDITDVAEEHRFLHTEDGLEAQLVYRVEDDRLVLVHTEVPDPLSGRGIAGHLVRAAVARAEDTGETLVPVCPYARSWLEDHPDETDGVTIDWSEQPS